MMDMVVDVDALDSRQMNIGDDHDGMMERVQVSWFQSIERDMKSQSLAARG